MARSAEVTVKLEDLPKVKKFLEEITAEHLDLLNIAALLANAACKVPSSARTYEEQAAIEAYRDRFSSMAREEASR